MPSAPYLGHSFATCSTTPSFFARLLREVAITGMRSFAEMAMPVMEEYEKASVGVAFVLG
jgi:hypothetical protein